MSCENNNLIICSTTNFHAIAKFDLSSHAYYIYHLHDKYINMNVDILNLQFLVCERKKQGHIVE